MATYKASKTQVPGRLGWVVVFRHPIRKDRTGKAYRVRAGLATREEAEADVLIEQLNQLLQDEAYWKLSARDIAIRRFDKRIVDIFYENMAPSPTDPWQGRDEVIPLPSLGEGYSKVRFIGQTGAGKTTLLRQLIGSDPKRDRFPSTSAAKTTTCDIEIVIAPGPYKAVVSFMPPELVRDYIKECVVASALAAANGAGTSEIQRRLLEHVEQRFRLSYILGTVPKGTPSDEEALEDEVDEIEEEVTGSSEEASPEERSRLHQKLESYFIQLTAIGEGRKARVMHDLGFQPGQMLNQDEDVAMQDLLEEELYDDDQIEQLVDEILDDVEDRFSLLERGELERSRDGWPNRWTIEEAERDSFIKIVNRFTGNYGPNFGQLLTPLVLGIRVRGPFCPSWHQEGDPLPQLVLMDGEGLGHTPESVASLSTTVTKSYEKADVILLVDNAAQPMQAGSQAVFQSVCAGGHQSKLALAFTHFDLVVGDNLRSSDDRREHVLNSVSNSIKALHDILGSSIAHSLEKALEGKVFYFSKINLVVEPNLRYTRQQIAELLAALQKPAHLESTVGYRPLYDQANLVLAVYLATEKFQQEWQKRLVSEHWARIKALSRRVAVFHADEYDTLRPVADLIRLLAESITNFVMNPRAWSAPPPEDIRSAALDRLRQTVYTRLHSLAFHRICEEFIQQWTNAFLLRGTGSTRVRAQNIRSIYELAAPIPGEMPRKEASELLDEVRQMFDSALEEASTEDN